MSLAQVVDALTERVRGYVHASVTLAVEELFSKEADMGWDKYRTSDPGLADPLDPAWAFKTGFEAGMHYARNAPELPTVVAPVTPLRRGGA